MLQCASLIHYNQKVFAMGFSNQPLVVLALVLITYGSLLTSSQVIPEIYLKICSDCVCKDILAEDTTGIIFLLAGLVLLSTATSFCKIFLWIIFALFFGIGAHGVLMIFSSMRAYAKAAKQHCDFLKIFFVIIAVSSLLLAISALVAAVFFCQTCNGCFSFGAISPSSNTIMIRPRRRFGRSARHGGLMPFNSSLV